MKSSLRSWYESSKYPVAWTVSACIHLIVIAISLYSQGKTQVPTKIIPPVRVQLHEILRPTAAGLPQKSGQRSETVPTSRKPGDSVRPSTPNYTELLPAAPLSVFEGPSSVSSQRGTRFSRETKRPPTEQMPVDRIASRIKLPLRWRGQADEGKAVAHLSLAEDQKIWIRSLYGEPVMRASLYESLKTEEMRSYIKRLMIGERRQDFSIVLRFLRVAGTYRGVNNEAVSYQDGVEITKTLPAPMRQFSGVPLSDSHSKRGDLIQQLELQKLMESPAFAHIITDEPL